MPAQAAQATCALRHIRRDGILRVAFQHRCSGKSHRDRLAFRLANLAQASDPMLATSELATWSK